MIPNDIKEKIKQEYPLQDFIYSWKYEFANPQLKRECAEFGYQLAQEELIKLKNWLEIRKIAFTISAKVMKSDKIKDQSDGRVKELNCLIEELDLLIKCKPKTHQPLNKQL